MPARGIGNKAQETLQEFANEKGISLLEAARDFVREKLPRISSKLNLFLNIFDVIKSTLKTNLYSKQSTLLENIDYRSHIEKKFPKRMNDKMANVHELQATCLPMLKNFQTENLIDGYKIFRSRAVRSHKAVSRS